MKLALNAGCYSYNFLQEFQHSGYRETSNFHPYFLSLGKLSKPLLCCSSANVMVEQEIFYLRWQFCDVSAEGKICRSCFEWQDFT